MTFTVVYDANVPYPNTLRDLLIRIAQSGTVQAKWTIAILDEMGGALRRTRPDIPEDKLERLRELMNRAVRDCLVAGYEPLIEGLKLPDPDDRHVLAAAIKAGAQVIVTRNLKDFPRIGPRALERRGQVARCLRSGPVHINVRAVAASVRQIADSAASGVTRRIRPPHHLRAPAEDPAGHHGTGRPPASQRALGRPPAATGSRERPPRSAGKSAEA